jgi:hypothetical protein
MQHSEFAMLGEVRTDRVVTSCQTRLTERSFQSSSVATLTLRLSLSLGYCAAGQVDVAQTSCLLVQALAVKLWSTTPLDVRRMVKELSPQQAVDTYSPLRTSQEAHSFSIK